MDDRLSQHGALSARELIKICHICKATRRRQTQRQFYMLLMLQPIAQRSCGFTFPTQMFLFSPLDVTQVSAKTPCLSQAQVRIIAKSSFNQSFMLLALLKQQHFLPFMLYVGLTTQAAFLEEGKLAGKPSLKLEKRSSKVFQILGECDSQCRDDGLN